MVYFTINNTRFSDYRLSKMLDVNKNVALELRGWHGFLNKIGLGNLQTVKTKLTQLDTLWKQLHSNSNYTLNDNVSYFITFNKMKRLFDSENRSDRPQFKIREVRSEVGLSENFNFSINDHFILKTPTTIISKELLKKFTDDNGVIMDNMNIKDIYDELKNDQIIKDQAANTIAMTFKRFNERLENKDSNSFGYKFLTYINPKNKQDIINFVVSANKVIFRIPEISLNGQSGVWKRVIGKDNQSVLFELLKNGDYDGTAYTSNKIEEILIKLKIKNYLVTHRFSSSNFIARNGGDLNLSKFITNENNEKIVLNDFKDILRDTKTLHENRYYHMDIKPDNIQVKRINNTNRFYIVDLDTFSSVNKKSYLFGTPIYTTKSLEIEVDDKKNQVGIQIEYLLQTFDEYAFVISILEVFGCNLDEDSIFDSDNLTPVQFHPANWGLVNNFIDKHIIVDHQQKFRDLLSDPLKYARDKKIQIYLFDMFKFND